jgi:hypothetical protein
LRRSSSFRCASRSPTGCAGILAGRLRPGAVLVETALAEQLNVSRAPIREAIADP